MTTDEEIYARARDVIVVYGRSARYFGSGCLEDARQSGNNAEAEKWRSIIAAIQFLQLERPLRSGMN